MIDIEMDSNTKDRRQGMFSTDKPITNAEDDKLGRSGFAERLAKAINERFGKARSLYNYRDA